MSSPLHTGSGALAGRTAGDDPARLKPDLDKALTRLFREAAGGDPPSERHLEVLRTALILFAERGYTGASLRELARRLGVQQPSLYHYFETKEQLAEQVIVHVGAELLGSMPNIPLPEALEDVPAFAIAAVMNIWDSTLYSAFVRFLFVVSGEQTRFRKAMQALYEHGARATAAAFLEPFIARGEIEREEGYSLLRIAVNSVALAQIEERLLYGRTKPSPELRVLAEHTERWLRGAIQNRQKK